MKGVIGACQHLLPVCLKEKQGFLRGTCTCDRLCKFGNRQTLCQVIIYSAADKETFEQDLGE